MISLRNVELPLWYGQWLSLGIKTSFPIIANPHTYQTFIGEEKEDENSFSLPRQFSSLIPLKLKYTYISITLL